MIKCIDLLLKKLYNKSCKETHYTYIVQIVILNLVKRFP